MVDRVLFLNGVQFANGPDDSKTHNFPFRLKMSRFQMVGTISMAIAMVPTIQNPDHSNTNL